MDTPFNLYEVAMKFSSIVARIGGDKGTDAWAVHHRAAGRKRDGEDVIVLSIGEPDFDTPRAIVDAAVASMRAGHTRYTSAGGIRPLREAIAERHARATGLRTEPEQVVVLPGAQCGLYATIMCVAEQGDEVLSPEPRYVTYDGTIGACGARMSEMPLRPENGFQVDPADLSAALTSRTRAILINSPHNPTGTALNRASLDALAEACRGRDIWLISDEVYSSLVFDHAHISPCSLPGMAERTVTVSSMSKSHAMTGWRLGWLIAPPALARHAEDLASCMLFGCPEFIQEATVTALRDEPPEVAEMVSHYRNRRDLVCRALQRIPGLRCNVPEGGMYVMLDVRGLGMTGAEFAWDLLDTVGVGVLPGAGFGPSAAGHVRISFAAGEDDLREACARIGRFVAGLRPRVAAR